jgi:hypothetical protein
MKQNPTATDNAITVGRAKCASIVLEGRIAGIKVSAASRLALAPMIEQIILAQMGNAANCPQRPIEPNEPNNNNADCLKASICEDMRRWRNLSSQAIPPVITTSYQVAKVVKWLPNQPANITTTHQERANQSAEKQDRDPDQ